MRAFADTIELMLTLLPWECGRSRRGEAGQYYFKYVLFLSRLFAVQVHLCTCICRVISEQTVVRTIVLAVAALAATLWSVKSSKSLAVPVEYGCKLKETFLFKVWTLELIYINKSHKSHLSKQNCYVVYAVSHLNQSKEIQWVLAFCYVTIAFTVQLPWSLNKGGTEVVTLGRV